MNILTSDIQKELGKNFINYAAAVNSDRAIPDSFTGLKPVARRILFIMQDEKVASNKPHKKSAKVVGSVMGRVHPHGDSSIYEAMARLAQPWVMRYPLIDWHGNYGNQGGDGPAASRYTEARLSKLAEDGLLGNLKKQNVEWQSNYSEDELEPLSLPALFPNLLCNSNTGIGVAMACNFAPHNLTEVGNLILTYLDKGVLDYSNIAPDFPTGGTIINKSELINIYNTGKGKAIVRGKYTLEEKGNKKLIIFTEIPYGVKTEDLLENIAELCNKETITGIDEIRNESGKKGLKLVFEISKGFSESGALNQLFQHTDLQKTFSVNQVALVDKVPTLLNWKECIDIYIKGNIDIIIKEAQFDLTKAEARLEIVEGLLKALEDIDNIIALIKKSKSAAAAKEDLIKQYKFSENQAKAIIDMKLGKIAGLEKIELNEERDSLISQTTELKLLITSDTKQKTDLVTRLTSFVSKYGDNRRTTVTNINAKPEDKEIATVASEDVVVVVSASNEFKRIKKSSFRTQKKGGRGVKSASDSILSTISTNTIDNLLMFTNKGKMYKILVDNIPEGTNVSKPTKITTLIDLENGEDVIAVTSLDRKNDKDYVVFITKQGLVKKTELQEYTGSKKSTGLIAIKLKENDSIANINIMNEEELILLTHKGMSIRFTTKDINAIGRNASGVKGIKLSEDDYVLGGFIIDKDFDLAVFSEKGFGKKMKINEFSIQGRGGKGVAYYKPTINTGDIIGATMVTKDTNVLLSGITTICISAEEIPQLARTSIGNIMSKNNIIKSIVRI